MDVLLRGGSIALLLIIALTFAFSPGVVGRKSASAAGAAFTIAAYVLVSAPSLISSDSIAQYVLIGLAILAPVFIYWFGVEMFIDRPTLKWWHVVGASAIALGGWAAPLSSFAPILRSLVVLAAYGHLLWVVVATANDDLVPARLIFRKWVFGLLAVLGTSIVLLELSGASQGLPLSAFLLQSSAIALVTIGFALWSLALRQDLWITQVGKGRQVTDLAPADQAVLMRLRSAMENDVWRNESLSVGQLAKQIDTQEHRLRRIINQGLGYRNFSTFINTRRVDHAKVLLADPQRADTPVLSIALDSGFASLGPFNRAFRDITGTNPTSFRNSKAAMPTEFEENAPKPKN